MKVIVTVKPGSKKGPLVENGSDGSFTIYVRERAIEGAANTAIINLLAKHFDVAKSKVTLVTGAKSKLKVVDIDN